MAESVFTTAITDRPNRNWFNLKHDRKMSFNMGCLIPTACIDVLPGDKFNISVENLLRFAPLIAPVMHEIMVKTYWFFVPNRLIWEDWEDFIAPPADQVTAPEWPHLYGETLTEGSLSDYLGFPPSTPSTTRISAMPVAAYELIWHEWFKDQNIHSGVSHPDFQILTEGENNDAYNSKMSGACRRKVWDHDYFTSGLPWAQKGTAVTLPLVDNASVDVTLSGNTNSMIPRFASTGNVVSLSNDNVQSHLGEIVTNTNNDPIQIDPNGVYVVNLNDSAATVNELRDAFAMQRFHELDAFGGTRYSETIWAHFGVRTRDSRLQRPELIGRFSGRMAISEVLQTAAASGDGTAGTTGDSSPLGTLGGHGISVNGGSGLNYYATEHGWLMGLICVYPKASYQQGIPRKFLRDDRYSYFWPKLQHIGEQAIENQELYADHGDPEDTFAYGPRYGEYKYERCSVHGELRSSLSHWHLGRIFSNEPGLNSQFLECTPSARIFAVPYEGGGEAEYANHQIIAHIYNNVNVSRMMSKYGKPV